MTQAARGVLVTVLLLGCTVQPTQLVVIVDTDMTPQELDGFSTRVLDGHGKLVDERTHARGPDPPAVLLPATFGVAPRDRDADRRVTVEVAALHGDQELFRTRAVTGFVPEQALALDMFLARRCVLEAETCGTGRTCRRTGCEPEVVDPDSLSRYREPDLRRDAAVADASIDAAPRDAAADAPADAGGVVAVPWAVLLEGAHLLEVVDGAVAARGTFALAGNFRVAFTIGADEIPGLGLRDGFVAAFAGDGALDWITIVGGVTATVTVTAVDVDPAGGIWVSGLFDGVLDTAGGLDSGGAQAGFLVRLDEDGSFAAAHAFTSPASATVEALAVDPEGRIAVGGAFAESLDSPLGSADASGNAGFVGILDDRGGFSCLVVATGATGPAVTSVGWTPAGDLVAGGPFSTNVAIDAAELVVEGVRDAFVASLDGSCVLRALGGVGGSLSWVRVGAPGARTLLLARSLGDLTVAGAAPSRGALDLLRAADVESGGLDPLALDGGGGNDVLFDVSIRGDRLWAAGSIAADATFGEQTLTSVGGTDGFVLSLDEEATVLLAQRFGGAGDDAVQVVANDRDGALLIAGTFAGEIDLGAAGGLTGNLASSRFAARLPP